VIDLVYAFPGAHFRRSNAGEARSSAPSVSEAQASVPQASIAANSVAQSSATSVADEGPNQGDATALPAPPPQWHKRGAWIDPAHIEKRMLADDTEKPAANHKEPETEVAKSVAALIRVRFLLHMFSCMSTRVYGACLLHML
jgi:hypothetical protein